MHNELLKILAMALGLPILLVGGGLRLLEPGNQMPETTTVLPLPPPQTTLSSPHTAPNTTVPVPDQPSEPISVQVIVKDAPVSMDLEDYLLGVMLAEVPASFHEDALRAQAVAARTYTLMSCTVRKSHEIGAVCTDSTCCQAYVSPETYILEGGKWSELEKMRLALEVTRGKVLTYDGKLIVSTYFSCSGGRTEDAVAVWGAAYPYLQAVDSPGEETYAGFEKEKIFTAEEIEKALGVRLEGKPESWFTDVSYTSGGGVKQMKIGGVSYKGTTLRSLLGLRSTVFTVSFHNDFIFIRTKGYGHRVGMSQYGANAMADRGESWENILVHYYPGTALSQYSLKNEKNFENFS